MHEKVQKAIRERLGSMPQGVPDLTRPTARATSVMCESDGGSFVLTFAELRPVAPYTAEDRFESKSGYVEVGRVALSPVAFAHLKQVIAQAEEHHVNLFGPLPNLEKFYDDVLNAMPDRKRQIEIERAGYRG